MTAYNGTIYNPPQKAIINKLTGIDKFEGFVKNSAIPIICALSSTAGRSLTYHNNTLANAIPYAEAGTYFAEISPL